MRKYILTILILILLSICVSAETYEYLGYNDNIAGDTFIDDDYVISGTKGLTDSYGSPLVADLDNDGTNEVIIMDSLNVEIYQGLTLTSIDAITFSSIPYYTYIYDIDGDSYKEIIAVTSSNISILEYNGTTLKVQNSFSKSFLEGSVAVACKGEEDCVLTSGDFVQGIFATVNVKAHFFNSTNFTYTGVLATESSGSGSSYRYIFCPATVPYIEVKNHDLSGDGSLEYVVSYIMDSTFDTTQLHVLMFDTTETTATVEATYSFSSGLHNPVTPPSCVASDKLLPRIISSTLTADFDGFPSNGMETVFAYMKNDNEFKLKMVSSSGVLLDTYPAVFDGDGIIVSNPIKANVFDDTGYVDFCVLGYQSTIEEIDLLCGSAQTGGIESKEFDYDITSAGNIGLGTNFHNVMIQSTNALTNYESGTELSDVSTPYGTFYIDYSFDNELIPIHLNTYIESSNILADVIGNDRNEQLVMTETTLYLINDGFVNSQVQINNIVQNPASPICENTTLTFTASIEDVENDAGNCTFSMYYNNGTLKENQTLPFGEAQGSVIAEFDSNETGIYSLTVTCNDDESEQIYQSLVNPNIVISDDFNNCYLWNEKESTTTTISEIETAINEANEQFEEGIDELLDGISVSSTKARNILALIIVLLSGSLVYMKTKSMELSIGGGVVGAVISFVMGIMSILPLVIVIIVACALVVRNIMKG